MSASINLHNAVFAEAHSVGGKAEWLTIRADDGSHVSIFMPHTVAVAMADVFNARFKTPEIEAPDAI